jgi:hypothetical protein
MLSKNINYDTCVILPFNLLFVPEIFFSIYSYSFCFRKFHLYLLLLYLSQLLHFEGHALI